jgi:hypothetical protein
VDGGGTPRPTRFAADFRRIVIPTLTREINRLAPDVADGGMAFSDAMAELMRLAYQRGAGYLPEGLRDELLDWVATTLLDEVDLVDEAQGLVESLLREPSRDAMRAAIRKFLDDG